ncbi:MAG: phosphatase PAP2 family protein [Oscillospiraceae bacterium]|nr:phosphatase PAP2 family protein [Oscillospiraceae bacterium]
MELLYLLEKIRLPILDEIMLIVTMLGEETAFLAIALIVFWCVDKKRGYLVMAVGFMGTVANQFLKLLCRVPRPWVLDENFTVVGDAKEAAGGYSFPSGHSQNAVGTLGAVALTDKKRWIKVICVAFMALVPFSRMYLGVHTLADVLVGSGMALALVWGLYPVIFKCGDKGMRILIAVMIAMSIGLLAYVELFPFPADMDAHNLESGVKNAYTMIGCLVGVAVVFEVEKRYICFETKAVWWAQLLKIALGLGVVLLVKEGLRSPLEALFSGHMAARAVRYFLIVLVAGLAWPATFRWFAKLGYRKESEV